MCVCVVFLFCFFLIFASNPPPPPRLEILREVRGRLGCAVPSLAHSMPSTCVYITTAVYNYSVRSVQQYHRHVLSEYSVATAMRGHLSPVCTRLPCSSLMHAFGSFSTIRYTLYPTIPKCCTLRTAYHTRFTCSIQRALYILQQ